MMAALTCYRVYVVKKRTVGLGVKNQEVRLTGGEQVPIYLSSCNLHLAYIS